MKEGAQGEGWAWERGGEHRRRQSSAENGRGGGHHIKGLALSGRLDRGACVCMCVRFICTCCSGGRSFTTTFINFKWSFSALRLGPHLKITCGAGRRCLKTAKNYVNIWMYDIAYLLSLQANSGVDFFHINEHLAHLCKYVFTKTGRQHLGRIQSLWIHKHVHSVWAVYY